MSAWLVSAMRKEREGRTGQGAKTTDIALHAGWCSRSSTWRSPHSLLPAQHCTASVSD
jgi:hypothetical protein